MRSRIWVLLLLVVLAACASPPEEVADGPAAGVQQEPLAVLNAWDAARSLAWANADLVALAGLYVPGAPSGVADVARLRRYQARGLQVNGLEMQVLAVRVVVRRPARLRLDVVERFAGAEVLGDGPERRLPAGVPVRRMIDLRRPADRWLVAAVRPLPPEAPR